MNQSWKTLIHSFQSWWRIQCIPQPPSEVDVLFNLNLSRHPFLGQVVNLDLLLCSVVSLHRIRFGTCCFVPMSHFYSETWDAVQEPASCHCAALTRHQAGSCWQGAYSSQSYRPNIQTSISTICPKYQVISTHFWAARWALSCSMSTEQKICKVKIFQLQSM